MNSVEKRQLNIQKYNNKPTLCKYCGIALDYDHRHNNFCCNSHRASYTNSHRILSEQSKLEKANKISKTLKANKTLKIKHCIICNQPFETYGNSAKYCSKHKPKSTSKCIKYKPHQRLQLTKTCKTCGVLFNTYYQNAEYCSEHKLVKNRKLCWCGNIKKLCKRPDICKKHQIFPTLEKYFGFDKSVIGTEKLYQEFERVVNLLKEDYWDNKLSMPDMIQKYNYYNNPKNFYKILKSLDIHTRSPSDAMKNALITGKALIRNNDYSYYKHRLSYNVG